MVDKNNETDSKSMIRKGDIVTFKREFMDAGDEDITFRAIEDEDGGRVLIVAELGLPINPTQVVRTSQLN